MAVDEQIDEEAIHRVFIHSDAAIAIRGGLRRHAPFQPIQRALARQRTTAVLRSAPVLTRRIVFAHARCKQSIAA